MTRIIPRQGITPRRRSPRVWPTEARRSTFAGMNAERRAAPRTSARVYFNKYVDGHPHLCEAVELSRTGMLLRRVHGPDAPRAAYALELASGPLAPGETRVWLCGSPVWSAGDL